LTAHLILVNGMPALPSHWTTASATLLAPVSAGPSLLLLDYDGTLAPFHDDRMKALPWPGVRERLDRLSTLPSVQLALVTGRSARELAALLALEQPVEIWGSHGREHMTAEGAYTVATLAPVQQHALDQLEAAYTAAGFAAQVERKPASLATHWRTLDAAGAAQVEQIAREAYAGYCGRTGLQLMVFDGGVEMRSPSITKGNAALHMLNQSPTAATAYLGDDVTDEDAFAALRGRGLTVLVRETPRPTEASFWLQPPGELLSFLDAWIQAAERALA
jgi:trehalose-phosphatase